MHRSPRTPCATPRLARAGLLAGSSATLAVAAHALAGGGAPDTGLTVLLTVLVAGAGTALAERSRRTVSLVGLLAVSHLLEHLLLTMAHQHASAPNGLLMTGAHLVAVLLTAVLLASADRGLSVALTALGMLLPRFRVVAVPPPPARPLPVLFGFRPLRTEYSVLLSRVLCRRGPPVCPE